MVRVTVKVAKGAQDDVRRAVQAALLPRSRTGG